MTIRLSRPGAAFPDTPCAVTLTSEEKDDLNYCPAPGCQHDVVAHSRVVGGKCFHCECRNTDYIARQQAVARIVEARLS